MSRLKATDTSFFSIGELVAYNAQIKAASGAVAKLVKEREELKKQSGEGNNDSTSPSMDASSDKNKFAVQEAEYYNKMADIKKRYLTDSKMTQEDYYREMEQAEIDFLNAKLKVVGVEPDERQKITDQLLNTQIQMRDKLDELEKKSQKEKEQEQKKVSERAFTALDKDYQLKVEAATLYHYENLTSEKDYLDELRRLQDRYYQNILDDVSIGEEKKNEIRKRLRERELDDSKRKAEEEINLKKQQFDTMSDLAKDFGQATAQFLTDSETTLGDYLKNFIKTPNKYRVSRLISVSPVRCDKKLSL